MRRSEFIEKMKSARNAQVKAIDRMNRIMVEVDKMGVTLSEPCDIASADNIGDAISCYVTYGEMEPEDIWDEIMAIKYGRSE